ncbi:hypothetical protein L7F22_001116 [Adiantum nelumboides]|nr:hypothetical protein [Adiantum nelumboides]
MDCAKVKAIKTWPDLKTMHDVRSFLRLCSYYRRFIRNFTEIASHLHALQKKGVTFRRTQKEISAFNFLKEKMTSDPVIVLPDLRKSFVVECDGYVSSIGAVLMQDGRVVAYESRILQGSEKTMQVYKKDLSAVIHALLSWKHYLLGADFVVQKDHQILQYFLTQAKLSEKHMRWANILSMFHFQIVHVEGKKNVVADALSRKPQISAVSIPYHHELDDMKEQYVKKAYYYIHKNGLKSKLMAAAVRNKQDLFSILGVDYIITPVRILQSLQESIALPDDKYSFVRRLSPADAETFFFTENELVAWDQETFAEALGPAAEELLASGLESYVSNTARLEEYFAKIWPPPNV